MPTTAKAIHEKNPACIQSHHSTQQQTDLPSLPQKEMKGEKKACMYMWKEEQWAAGTQALCPAPLTDPTPGGNSYLKVMVPPKH
jgi:hypothetical protein